MKNNEIKIKHGSSSLSEFVKRPLPNEEEAAAFDEYVEHEAKEEEIKDSLARIYQDDQGEDLNINKLTVKEKRGWFFNLFTFAVVLFALGGAVYASYNYLYLRGSNRSAVDIAITGNKETAAGEEFYYNFDYKNEDRVGINNIEIKATYPDNFIFLESDPKPSKNNDTWEIAGLASHRSDSIKIKGKLVGPQDGANVILADMTYTPENFSSEFKKSASFETKINDLGLDFSFINSSSALINEDNEIIVKFKAKDENYLNNFRLTFEPGEGLEIIKSKETATSTPPAGQAGLSVQPEGNSAWLLSNFGKNENEFKINFKVKEKKQPNLEIKLKFEFPYTASTSPTAIPEKYYLFYEKVLTYEIIKSDLNINLIINGSSLDQGTDFSQTLNYSINYANKGDSLMKDVIIMAVLESDFLDWQALSDKNNGKVSGNAISWSKSEIPALSELNSGAEGVIDFSIKLKPKSEIDLSKAYQVKSYVKYSIAGKSAADSSQSNIIINKINSDLDLSEQVRYFNDDNIAVGSGPLPPKVGQITGLKVYWNLTNNLHELSDLQISVTLPANVRWDNKNRASIGTIIYDPISNKVVWQIGRLPVSVFKADAEFNINVTPAEADRNKIMVILPGTSLVARDSETGSLISKTLKAKTTKLEDDSMASGDGVIQ